MGRRLYSTALYTLMPLIWRRVWRETLPGHSRRERLGEIFDYHVDGDHDERILWVHAASVGEVMTARALIRSLIDDYPDHRVVVTTMTATGAERVRALFADRVTHHFLPLDFPGATRRFIARLRPELGIIVETELWPNLIRAATDAGTPIAVVNARITLRAFARYQRFRSLMHEPLQRLTWVGAKSAEDAKRFRALGVAARNLTVTGVLKFDLAVDDVAIGAARELRASWGERPVWIAASTHEGEEHRLLAVHQSLLALQPDTLMILVPRHPQRFEAVFELCCEQGLRTVRRSRQEVVTFASQVYLGDTMGELMLLYGCADIAFVAGSWLESVGGHNLLEPAALGVPVLSGPQLSSLCETADALAAADARLEVGNEAELVAALTRLFNDAAARRQLAAAARAVVATHRGALALTRRQLARLIEAQSLALPIDELPGEPASVDD